MKRLWGALGLVLVLSVFMPRVAEAQTSQDGKVRRNGATLGQNFPNPFNPETRIPFSVGMSALVQSKLTPRSAVDAMTTGRRYGGADALAAGVVDAVHSEDELLPAAIALATSLAGKDRMTLGTIKERMFAHVTAPLLQGAAG